MYCAAIRPENDACITGSCPVQRVRPSLRNKASRSDLTLYDGEEHLGERFRMA